jgi:hypothetical protein
MASEPLDPSKLILPGLRAAVRFLGLAWRRAWLAMLLAAAAMEAWVVLRHGPWASLWLVLALAALLVASGALWRLALGHAGVGPGGLQAGSVELRLIAVALLSVLFLMIVGLLGLIVMLAFAYAAASAGHGFVAADPGSWTRSVDPRGRAVLALVATLIAAGFAWAAARISLAAPASVSRDKVQVLATWPLTRGRAGFMMVAMGALVAAPTVVVAGVARAGAGLAGSGELALVEGLAILAFAAVWLPMSVGLMAYLFEQFDSVQGRAPIP